MIAAQIKKYSKEIKVSVNEVPILEFKGNEVLVKVMAASVNLQEILQLTGSVRLIQDYRMPLHWIMSVQV